MKIGRHKKAKRSPKSRKLCLWKPTKKWKRLKSKFKNRLKKHIQYRYRKKRRVLAALELEVQKCKPQKVCAVKPTTPYRKDRNLSPRRTQLQGWRTIWTAKSLDQNFTKTPLNSPIKLTCISRTTTSLFGRVAKILKCKWKQPKKNAYNIWIS